MATEEKQTTIRPRKKRKTYSCELCRKFKTRCDFEPSEGKCYRCRMLNLDCSLTNDPELNIKFPQVAANESSNNRTEQLEAHVRDMDRKMDIILSKLGEVTSLLNMNNSATRENTVDHSFNTAYISTTNGLKLQEPPLQLIQDIDTRLFPHQDNSESANLEKAKRPYVVARLAFWDYFKEHENVCLELSHQFLMKSHFWIIPGGIKSIDREFVEKHCFITSVFTIIAMGFDENDKYEKEQEELYPLVEHLLTNTLTMFEKLIDHDIEALLYCCMYRFTRKSKRYRQLSFNPLVLCNFAINSLLNIVDFHKIKERVLLEEQYNGIDLYHLRILNSLTACNLQFSIGFGTFTNQDPFIKELNNLIAKFPQSNFRDDIKLSEINLSDVVNGIFLNFKNYFWSFFNIFKQGGNRDRNDDAILVFPELDYWLKNWEELLSKDNGGILWFSYDFFYVMICRCFIMEFYQQTLAQNTQFLDSILLTMKQYCVSLLHGFLKLPPSLIKGAPIITTNQVVYACLTLCDFLHKFNAKERQQTLNLCTKIYWHLNAIGEKRNEATENVAVIIKSLIDTGKKKMFSSPDSSNSKTSPNEFARVEGLQQTSEIPQTFSIPDVNRFNSFEDFFQDFFENLQPTAQHLFSDI
ncbi:Urc2p [Kluyveromyces lactis]|uniref:KLLA0C01023p n=1 Tax=Kluyveromyces lactis (strain ATCC 8585 / CBS 2359 / DSM 70799 / NBRC 1267 / NRRL Y-1140 / WM37) TaxID=284590 RepID=Q6CUZ9_KLULA|nr:uncharacterized protein KLLA0_C01023g [Kluyveromyces lactis]CAH01091.1 KLLA0C01023p [Kluyveromyces lactis]|eukprot:XP_452240.1 uncharacterized protein KLLA0_C01023g [Kluyveromyces lactis]